MSTIARARLFSILLKNNGRFFSSVTVNPPKEPIISASSLLDSQPPPPPTSPPPPLPSGTEKKPWNFLKYGLISALTGGVATAGYATYAYTLDEINEKTKPLREPTNYTIGDEASAFDNFQALLHTAAMTVSAKFVELYLDLRRSIEEHVRGFTEPSSDKLLPDLHPLETHVFTLVLDLNETLLFSDWKDFSMLNRDPSRILYVSGNALESSLQPENCVLIKPWKGEADDAALVDLIPFLEYVATHRPADIRPVLASYQGHDIAKEFIERSKEYRFFPVSILGYNWWTKRRM